MGRRMSRWFSKGLIAALVVSAVVALPAAANAVEVPSVTGRVTASGTGEPLPNAYVHVVSPITWVSGGCTTDSNGYYEVSGLPDGTYAIYCAGTTLGDRYFAEQYYGGGQDWSTRSEFAVNDSTRPVLANMALTEHFPSIRGHVADAQSGEPLGNVKVDLYREDGTGSYAWCTSGYTNQDGQYEFWGLDPATYKVSFYDAVAEASEWWDNADSMASASPVVVVPAAAQTLDAQIQRPGPSLAGQTTDEETGAGAEGGVEVFRRTVGGDWDYVHRLMTDAEGHWAAYNYPAGVYRMIFYSNDTEEKAYYPESWADKPALVDRGDDIVLEEGGSVTDLNAALKPRPVAGPDAFEPDDSMYSTTPTDPDGSASLHSFYPEGDVDWVKFPVKAGRLYRADAMTPTGDWIDGYIVFCNSDGRQIASGNSFVSEETGFAYAWISQRYFDKWNSWYEFAVTEVVDVDTATTLVAGFGSATNPRSELVVGYDKTAVLVGRLKDASGKELAQKAVIVERYDSALRIWVKVGDAAAGTTAGEYRYAVEAYRGVRTAFRMRFAGDTYTTGSVSLTRTIVPRTYVRTPIAPKTMSRTRSYKVTGDLKSRHRAGKRAVQIKCYKRRGPGVYKYHHTVYAKVSNDSIYSKYSASVKLPHAGKWRLKAFMPRDAEHAETWSAGYDYVKVR